MLTELHAVDPAVAALPVQTALVRQPFKGASQGPEHTATQRSGTTLQILIIDENGRPHPGRLCRASYRRPSQWQ
jgi:hypothetical protein